MELSKDGTSLSDYITDVKDLYKLEHFYSNAMPLDVKVLGEAVRSQNMYEPCLHIKDQKALDCDRSPCGKCPFDSSQTVKGLISRNPLLILLE